MPTPVAHSLAGFSVWLACDKNSARDWWLRVALLIFVSNLPDVDFVAGYLVGDPQVYHWRATHSLLAIVIVTVAFGMLFRSTFRGFQRAALAGGAAYGSHIVMDMLMGQPHNPDIGLQLLWPLSQLRFMAPWEVFHMAPNSIEYLGPVRTFFSRAILPIIAREVLVLTPVVIAIGVLRFMGTARRTREMET